jgi:hypothetical protein
MLDLAHLPTWGEPQYFIGTMSAVGSLQQTWVKPRGVSMLYMIALGQGGQGNAATFIGGGSGAQSTLLVPAALVPDVLYVGAGNGGKGTAINTYIAIRPCGATYNSIPVAADTFLSAGGAPGSAVTQGVIGSLALSALCSRGRSAFLTGSQGGAGGTAPGANTTGLMVTGGGAGGATTGAAGGTTALPTGYSIAAGGTATIPAGHGVNDLVRMVFGGGAGGGATGAGGDGGTGCGGGGPGTTGTVAGRGGPGLVVIWAW